MPRSLVSIGVRAVKRQFSEENASCEVRRDIGVALANVGNVYDTVVALSRWARGHDSAILLR